MATEVILPKFGFTLEESTVVEWLVEEGDAVEQGDPLCEVTTDKVNMEVEAPASGVVGGIAYQAGEVVPVTGVIAYILAEGESVPTPARKAAPPAQQTGSQPGGGGARPITPLARKLAEERGVDLAALTGSGPSGKIVREDVERALAGGTNGVAEGKVRATPAARRAAREHDLDLGEIGGSGPRGRVQEADVAARAAQLAASAPPTPTAKARKGVRVIPLEGMRKTIATRLQASYQTAPHITFTVEVDMTEALALKDRANAQLAEGSAGISMTAILLKACAWALRQHPLVNSHLVDDQILVQPEVNVGMAVALDEGLIVPVIHRVDRKGLTGLGAEVRDLAARARENRLRASDLSSGTFTVSNMGMFGIKQFTAIINPPEVAILAVGETAARFVPDESGQPVARPIMAMTLSADHRAIDGALAGRFITAVKQALEEPTLILL